MLMYPHGLEEWINSANVQCRSTRTVPGTVGMYQCANQPQISILEQLFLNNNSYKFAINHFFLPLDSKFP